LTLSGGKENSEEKKYQEFFKVKSLLLFQKDGLIIF
jgi:hypothetical protein